MAHLKAARVGKYLLTEKGRQNSFRAADVHSGQKLVCKVSALALLLAVSELRDYLDPNLCVPAMMHFLTKYQAHLMFPISTYLQSMGVYLQLPVHPSLAWITDVVFEDRLAYVFFDQSYGNLFTYIQTSGSLDEDEASRLFHQAVSAVAHCHSNDVVLHDLELKRFVFKNQERTRLMLTGLEDVHLTNECDDSVYGKHGSSVYYVSPEGLLAESKYSGKAADVWSLGVMLYIILVGRYPFSDSDPHVLFTKIQRCKFILPELLSPKARCLIRSILRADPSERLMAQEIMDHPWFSSPTSQRMCTSLFYRSDDQMVPELCSNMPIS